MPSVGLGLWKLDQPETADIIVNGVKSGYRHLDSAADYGNEIQVGEGIKQTLDKVFVVGKISGSHQSYGIHFIALSMYFPHAKNLYGI